MKWILETGRHVPDFRDPYLFRIFCELETLCRRVSNPTGTREQYFHDLKSIRSMLPVVADVCQTLRSATPLETIDAELSNEEALYVCIDSGDSDSRLPSCP